MTVKFNILPVICQTSSFHVKKCFGHFTDDKYFFDRKFCVLFTYQKKIISFFIIF